MEQLSQELMDLVERIKTEFMHLDDSFTSIKISEDKWSVKEIIGHLIDSASNNHQRFVRLRISNHLSFPDYKNEEWIAVQNYNKMNYNDVLNLFYYYNRFLANTLKDFNAHVLSNQWNVKWDENSEFITLGNLANHYVVHLKGHYTHLVERIREIEAL